MRGYIVYQPASITAQFTLKTILVILPFLISPNRLVLQQTLIRFNVFGGDGGQIKNVWKNSIKHIKSFPFIFFRQDGMVQSANSLKKCYFVFSFLLTDSYVVVVVFLMK